jgi:hypothetical protein
MSVHLLVNLRNCLPLRGGATNLRASYRMLLHWVRRHGHSCYLSTRLSSNRPLWAQCDLNSFGCLDMTRQWCNALVVPTMCVNSRLPYEHSTIVCVCLLRLAHHDHTPYRQRIGRHQRYSTFRHLNKEHDSNSMFNTMNGVSTSSLLPIHCKSSKESLIGALSVV